MGTTALLGAMRFPKFDQLLHGDLHHENILRDAGRGWVCIDPKGVVAGVEFEFGAALRNPPGVSRSYFESSSVVARVARFAGVMQLDRSRVLGWAFSQAIPSAIWTVQDEGALRSADRALQLATALRPLLD